MQPISVLVVDDHAVFADALRARLDAEQDLAPVIVAYSVAAARAKLAAQRPDVVILDMYLGDGSGLQVADEVRELAPEARILMLSASDSVDSVVDALASGVRGWMSKTVEITELIDAIRAVHRGEAWLHPALLGQVLAAQMRRSASPPPDPLGALTEREREVLDCLAAGMSRAESAARLQVSVNTVRSHIQNLTAKLGVHTTLEAAALRNSQRSLPNRDLA
ncbi:MAG TPA: response regulator transcription factor [Jatrophihabitantaceae bacterium]|nr:response regulator transcription factor [Jatrophihabitantaceae bacterium]